MSSISLCHIRGQRSDNLWLNLTDNVRSELVAQVRLGRNCVTKQIFMGMDSFKKSVASK